MNKWKIRRSMYIHRDQWISVRADECVTRTGVEISPYYVLEYPDFVHTLCFDVHGKVVMVKQYRHGAGEMSLELPGGCIDNADRDPISAAMRELREETGYVADVGRLVASLTVDPAKFSNRVHLVLIHNATPLGERRPDESEDLETVLVDPQDVIDLALNGRLINAVHVGMVMVGLKAAGMLTRLECG